MINWLIVLLVKLNSERKIKVHQKVLLLNKF